MTHDPLIVGLYHQDAAAYPTRPPFDPPEAYPELPRGTPTDPSNRVYASVRELFRLLGYDAARFGSRDWNPLGWLVRPGDRVFIKPNMISHKHRLNDDWEYVITHGSVIRAVTDYVALALQGRGSIMLGDAPQTDSLMDQIVEHMGLAALQALLKKLHGIEVEILDLRDVHHVDRDGIYVKTVRLPGDPRGSVCVDLGNDSMFSELDDQGKRYYGAYYDWRETNEHQRKGKHEYAISRSPLTADVFINLPKLKTHKKCGLTVNLKSLVGINANKNWLPHYAFGAPDTGGDQFERHSLKNRLENLVVMPAKHLLLQEIPLFQRFARRTKKVGYEVFGDTEEVVRSGNWHGNDTVWRMSLDLNRILLYGNEDGSMRGTGMAKRYFSVVDGIVAMEGNGPVAGTPRTTGILLAGMDPVGVDAACARLMGFDYAKLPLISRALLPHRYALTALSHADIRVRSNVGAWDGPIEHWRREDLLDFRPHFGWIGRIELEKRA